MKTARRNPGWWLSASLTTLLIATVQAADTLPPIQAPIGFEEGTDTQLQSSQLEEILPWATNSKETLKDLIETTKSFSYQDSKDLLLRGIQDVVMASAPKRTELLMRYVLNRALKVNQIIEREADISQPGIIDLQVRMLRLSAQMALEYYESDVAYLNGRFVEKRTDLAGLAYAGFGVRYLQFLSTLDQSLFDASAQYNVAILALGLFQWDLYRDQDRLLYAPVIAKVDRFLKLSPAQALRNDPDTIKWLRKVKKVTLEVQAAATELLRKAGHTVPQVQAPVAQAPDPVPVPGLSFANRELYLRHLGLLNAPTWMIRHEAVLFLSTYKNRQVLMAMFERYFDTDSDVKAVAWSYLYAYTLSNIDLDSIKRLLGHSSWEVRRDGVILLAGIKTNESTRLLIEMLGDRDADVRALAQREIDKRR